MCQQLSQQQKRAVAHLVNTIKPQFDELRRRVARLEAENEQLRRAAGYSPTAPRESAATKLAGLLGTGEHQPRGGMLGKRILP